MKSGKYIKDRLYSMCIFVAMLIISVLMMAAFKVSVQLIIAEICIMIICYIAVVLADYYHRKKFYDELEANIAALEEKYLITETLVRPAFYEGQILEGDVINIKEFGAFIEFAPGKEGMVHISKIAKERINHVEDVLTLGDHVKVVCLGKDKMGRMSFSIKDAQ